MAELHRVRPARETINECAHNGSKVYLVGRPSARAWTGRQGDAQASLDVVVFSVELLDSKATSQDTPGHAGEPEGDVTPDDIQF